MAKVKNKKAKKKSYIQNKIYITGCARSGTTILARMFYAFKNVQVINEEVNLHEFCEAEYEGDKDSFIVGKRTEHTIFSNTLSKDVLKAHYQGITSNKIIVINCIRDGRFVVNSWWKAWGLYDPFAWMNSMVQAEDYRDVIRLTVRYEDLLNNPRDVQKKIMDAIGLKRKNFFSSYPKFVPDYCFSASDDKYKLRPLENLDKDIPLTYMSRPNDIKFFNFLLNHLGYVRD